MSSGKISWYTVYPNFLKSYEFDVYIYAYIILLLQVTRDTLTVNIIFVLLLLDILRTRIYF